MGNAFIVGNYPISIYKDAFLDENLSLEAKGLLGILVAFTEENKQKKDIDLFLSSIDNIHLIKLYKELEENNYLIYTNIKGFEGEKIQYITIDGQSYTEEMKIDLKENFEKEQNLF